VKTSRRHHRARPVAGAAGLALLSSLAFGCPPAGTEPAFPAGYAASYVEVRNCRRSPEHDLAFIRIVASPDAAPIYQARAGAFADGAVILKEEFADPDCTMLEGFTVMARERGAWRWQDVTAERTVLDDGALPRCVGCHSGCEEGFEQTCALP
jgi:hypothetical protein